MMAGVLDGVKSALGITGEYQDATLQIYINEVVEYMKDAGVPIDVINSNTSAGVIARGVTDLWNYNGGAGKLSDYFYQRVSQLSYQITPESDSGIEIDESTIDKALELDKDEMVE